MAQPNGGRVPSVMLGVIRPFRGMVDGFTIFGLRVKGWLTPPLLMLVLPFLIALCVEWRVLIPWRQYHGVFPGDYALSLAETIAIYHVRYYLPVFAKRRWYQSWQWQTWSVVLGVALAGFFAYGEFTNTVHQYVPSAAYTWPQLASPTHIFHYVIITTVGYLFWAVVIPMQLHVPKRHWLAKVLVLALIVEWGYCAIYLDNVSVRPDLSYIHPLNGGWFGGFGLHLWHILFG